MSIPTGKHTDWIWPFNNIDRKDTSSIGPPPERTCGTTELVPAFDVDGKPVLDAGGNQVLAPKPIPNPGEWHTAWPPYFAITTKDGWHFRIGKRWDDVDGYFTNFSFKIGKIK